MTPRRWDGPFPPSRPRRAVEGGAAVAKPGRVDGEEAAELVAAAEMETAPQILARGRTYARAGQVVAVRAQEGVFTAEIQGTRAQPYRVSLTRTTISGADRIAADCTCPYGCDFGWCKHAAALAYVAAFLVDTQPATATAWGGSVSAAGGPAAAAVAPPLAPEEVAALRRPLPALHAGQLLAAAAALVPHPWAGPAEALALEEGPPAAG